LLSSKELETSERPKRRLQTKEGAEGNLNVGGNQEGTIRIAVAGSNSSQSEAQSALQSALNNPDNLLAQKVNGRQALLAQTKVSLPDAALQGAFEWGKLNMADLKRTVTDAKIRDMDEGRAYPTPAATIPKLPGIGAGYPDYPWYFGTEGAYTAYPMVASGDGWPEGYGMVERGGMGEENSTTPPTPGRL